jgi:hypothetical protein
MLPDDAKIVSVGDHVIEHARVWLDRLPAKDTERAPHIVRLPDGNDAWLYEGRQSGNFAINAVAGKHPRDFGMDPAHRQQNRHRTPTHGQVSRPPHIAAVYG